MKNQPIIIIGAGRSGTNILRDSLCRLPGLSTWPCDEINYIWRHGNVTKKTDRFTASEARQEVKTFIKNEFDKFERNGAAGLVVEKTCANSLKVPFINEIFTEAKYLFIIRDGFDVASSAKQRWTAPLEFNYILKKARFVPISDIPYYGSRYFINRIKKSFSKEKRLAFWGPVYPGMVEDLKNDSLIEVCGKQWRECVETAYNDLISLAEGRVHFLKYDDFVTRPVDELMKVVDFLGLEFSQDELTSAVGSVSSRSIGNYKKHLSHKEIELLRPIIEPALERVNNNL